MGVESEDEEGPDGHRNGLDTQVMHSSIPLQQAWPQHGESSHTPADPPPAYYSPEQPQQLEYAPQHQQEPSSAPELDPVGLQELPPAEPIAIPVDGGESGEQVYIVPVMPEMVSDVKTPATLEEAEHALNQVIQYFSAHREDSFLTDEEYMSLIHIKHQVVSKGTSGPAFGRPRTKS